MTHDGWNSLSGAEIYAEIVAHGVLYRTLARALVDLLDLRAGERVLDLACGTGVAFGALSARLGSGAQIMGLDASPAMLELARGVHAAAGGAYVVADPGALPLAAASVDAALCSAAFWHFPARARSLVELGRVLHATRGRVAFNVPAAQLADVADLPPAPLQLALAREGERRFGAAPAPGGPVIPRAQLMTDAAAAGWRIAREQFHDVRVPQSELASLLAVPAIGARSYPDVSATERAAWIRAAEVQVDLTEEIEVRWWEILLSR